MATNVDITNRALAKIGTRSQITGMTDGSTEALYANLLYADLRDFMLREGDYDFSLKSASATVSGSVGFPWIYSYTYPSDCIRVRQLVPSVISPLDPRPVEWNVWSAGGALNIITKTAISSILYTYAPTETAWDAIFTNAFVDLLASALTMALTNRIEFSKEKLGEALQFAGIANLRDS